MIIDFKSAAEQRLLTRGQAATYCGYGLSNFSRLVANGVLPGPMPGLTRWDRKKLDSALDQLSGLTTVVNDSEDAFDAWERQKKCA